ncbi:lipopolysaccharide biosynthesis protein [Chryseobacterium sp. R2A-55]|uniref:lipopolysaccharide biosynthesis protein n=1 Tax=Chryseobacterium sp. R2A-55 TaxID=2744445 RepID=UPI001F35BB5B|nr:hypothetical protein [Chryseobacterium sp. R2A-55]
MKNILFGITSQVLQIVLSFVARTVFIKYLAIEYLGINSLFSNILMMLSLAELGVSAAFVYSLYKPLADKDEFTISVILKFYKKVYWIIGLFIFFSGLILIPFLDHFIAQKPAAINEDIRIIYFIFLFNTSSSYFFSYKISLLNADQQNSVVTINQMKFLILQNILQILVLVFKTNFIAYLLVQTLTQFASNYYVSHLVDKRYSFLRKFKTGIIDRNLKKTIISNTKSTFLIKVGGVMVNGTDNVFISYFVGLAILGKFSNYLMLVALVSNFTAIIFANLSSSIAHLIVTERKEQQRKIFYSLNFLNFWIFGVCALMIVFLVNDFIKLWIGEQFLLGREISILLAVNFFMVGMQSGFWTFKGAYGFFKQGRYAVLGTALINLVLSYYGGLHFGILGIIGATAIARLVTNFWYDPYVVLKLGLNENPMRYLLKFVKYLLVLGIAAVVTFFASSFLSFSGLVNFVLKATICFTLVNLFIILVFKNSPEFIASLEKLKQVRTILFAKIMKK